MAACLDRLAQPLPLALALALALARHMGDL